MKNLLPSVCHSDDCKEEESLPKNEERDSSHILGMTRGYRPSLLIAGNVGEGKMPAFIGLPGARKKTEIGRGLFERSEFRNPVGERSGRQEYPITSGRPFLVTSLRWERNYGTLLF